MFLFLLTLVSSANTVTLDLPANDVRVSGATYILSASLDTNTFNITNATFYYQTSGSSTWTLIGSTLNDSVTQFNLTWDTTSFTDDANFTINATLSNETKVTTTDTSTNIGINNTSPTASFGSDTFANASRFSVDNQFIISITTDSNGIDNCTVYSTTTTKSITASANSCSATYTPNDFSFANDQNYNITVEVFDGNGDVINSSTRWLTVTGGSSGSGVSYVNTFTESQVEPTPITTTPETPKISFGEKIKNFWNNLFKGKPKSPTENPKTPFEEKVKNFFSNLFGK